MTARPASPSLSRLLELLELEQPRVVTRGQLESLVREAGIKSPVDLVLQRLRERGWLLDLKTRGVWEFAPAARAGAYGSGDPLIELRATLARRQETGFAVAAESAAYLLSYASRRPDREVVSVPAGLIVPPALRAYRVVRWRARAPLLEREGLPIWGASTLVAGMAARPSSFRDWPNAGEWLSRAAADASFDGLRLELEERPRSEWARAAYLLAVGDQSDTADALIAAAPRGSGPYYLGPRDRPGRHARAFDVIDSTGMEVRSA
jgi:hypothetical protein